MKKIITLIAIVIAAITATSQPYEVLDTSYVGDQKLRVAEVLNQRLYDELTDAISREKVQTDTVINLPQTRAYYNAVTNTLNTYRQLFLNVDTVVIDSAMYQNLVTEYNELGARIEEIKNDPDIENETTIGEYKQIVARRAKLLNWYTQIQAQQ